MLRVRTGQKALRAVGESFFRLWKSGKVNWLEHAGGSQNKGTEKLQRRAAPSPLEEGGRGEGKGANSAPEKPPPPTLQTGPDSYLKTPETRPAARGGAAEGKGAPHLGRVRASLWLPELLATEGKGAPHPEEGAQAFGCLNR